MGDVVQQIKDKLSILDVVSPYVELHKAGKNFKGKSPFSAEKTPSFYVSPDRGMYYCFSTSQGGDIFNFVQVMEGVDFKEALKILAKKAGVELVPEDPKKRSERERLYEALEAATSFFQEKLTTEPEATKYLTDRGVKTETIKKWRIGYAPGPEKYGWRELKDHLESVGFTKDELLKAGLIKVTDSGKEPFDVFRNRVVFPMSEPSGKIVAFSGRILSGDSDLPKYVNSPETPLYKKSELLFGYDKAKPGIRDLNFSLIVEGQFDVVMCHQAGYTNTVAVSGTALTLNHVQLLERFSDKVVLALDADRAGIAAMKKAANLMLRRGLDVKVAELPLGKDPADLIKGDVGDFKRVVGKSVHVIEFLLHVLRREVSDDRSFKLKAQQEVYPFILLLPSRVDQDHFEQVVADVTKTSREAVRYELNRLREQVENQTLVRSSSIREVQGDVTDQKNLRVHDSINQLHIFLLASTQVVDSSKAKKLASEIELIKTISDVETPSDSDLAGTIFTLEQQFSTSQKLSIWEDIVSKLNQFKTNLIRKRLAELKTALKELELTEDNEKFMALLKDIKTYEGKLREPQYDTELFIKEGD